MRRTAAAIAAVIVASQLGSVPAQAHDDLPAPTLVWTDCGERIQCATAQVPLDYSKPHAETIDLAVTRVPATDPVRRIGALVLNPGGPGAWGAEFARAAEALFPDLLRRYDIVGFDPRGVARSGQVWCLTQPETQAVHDAAKARPTRADFARTAQLARQFGQRCLENAGARLLSHLGTIDVARDMDQLRQALGERKLNFYGLSYGTYLGTVYANMFPDKVGRMVLDGAVDPHLWANAPLELDRQQAIVLDRVFNRFFDWCKATPAQCAFGSGDPKRALEELVDKLEAQPQRVTENGRTRVVNGFTVLLEAMALPFSRDLWPVTADRLVRVANGEVSLIGATSANQRFTDFDAANAAIECADRRYPDLAAVKANIERTATEAPLLGRMIAYAPVATMEISNGPVCAQWPVRPKERYTGPFDAAGAPPILVVGTTHDPATPYQWAVSLANTLQKSRLLTSDGESHTAFGSTNPCADAHVYGWLLDGVLPPVGTVCTPTV